MGILDIFRRKLADDKVTETRSSGTGYTAQILAARESYITGMSDLAELSSAAQTCVSLWECGLAAADVEGTDMISRRDLAIAGRSLALRGEAVFLIREDRLIPAADWDLSTRDGIPRAYRISISEAGGGRTDTVLAGEVIHFRVGSDAVAPWAGQAPLRRSALSASLLQHVEGALRDTFANAPIGSQVLPLPDGDPADMADMRAQFRGRRGSTLIVEGVAQATAAGMNPQLGQRREDLTPDLHRAEAAAQLAAAKGSIALAFGVLPALFHAAATGPVIREAQRHLAQWTLEPIAKLMAEEASEKLGSPVKIDVARPAQAFDAGGRARAMSAIIGALAQAKEAGIDPGPAMQLVDWKD